MSNWTHLAWLSYQTSFLSPNIYLVFNCRRNYYGGSPRSRIIKMAVFGRDWFNVCSRANYSAFTPSRVFTFQALLAHALGTPHHQVFILSFLLSVRVHQRRKVVLANPSFTCLRTVKPRTPNWISFSLARSVPHP